MPRGGVSVGYSFDMEFPPKLLAKFKRHVAKAGPDDCWKWTGRKNERGYGRPTCNGVAYRSHRIAWELEYGPIPVGVIVRHTCDNPACCNPRHLVLGTHHDNMQDAVARGRVHQGAAHRQAKLNADAVRVIRSSSAPATLLARVFGVDRKTIWQARTGGRWRSVQ
jgi:hypothetical protein